MAAAPLFELGGAAPLGLLFASVAVFAAIGALSHQRERAFSASLIYLLLGLVGAAGLSLLGVGWLDPIQAAKLLEHLAEVAVVIALFGSGMKLERPLRWRGWGTVARLLLVAMPLTIGGVLLLGIALLGLSAAGALLLGAILAPTDPVLAGDLGVGPPGDEDEREPNFALTAEAGMNDGLAAPFILLGLLLAEGDVPVAEWALADGLYAVLGGTALGALSGHLMARSVRWFRDRRLLASELDGFLAIAAALSLYGLAEALGTYGFLAAFAGGLAFRRYEHGHELNRRVHDGAESAEKVGELAVVLVLGSLVTVEGLGTPGWEGWLVVAALLLVVRPLTVLLSLALSPMGRRGDRTFVAWFGVRGIGSIYYLGLVLGAGVLPTAEAELVTWTVVAAVIASIVVHGITGGPALRRLVPAALRPGTTGRAVSRAASPQARPTAGAAATGSASRPG